MRETKAEKLLEAANSVKHPLGVVATFYPIPTMDNDRYFSVIRLAQDFARLGKDLQLRAIMENWDQQRIVREIY